MKNPNEPSAGPGTGISTIVVIGKESVGKSQLVSSLTGRSAGETNFRGSTVVVERYRSGNTEYIDTPGILRSSDTETTRLALAALAATDVVLLVVQATSLDQDLSDMLPLVVGKRGAVVVTHWDRVQSGQAAQETIERLAADAGVGFIPVDARRLSHRNWQEIAEAINTPAQFDKESLTARAGWRIEPKPGWLEHQIVGPLLAILLLFLPLLATIFGANSVADMLHPIVERWFEPIIAAVNDSWPSWLQIVLTAQHAEFGYGLLNMGPFLLVWALPTVLTFALILGAYKASGLIERINVALHPLVRPFGLSGRDVVRVMMGFGCNVPAVISTRSCSSCSRGPAISAIAFGSACSYQLPATLAVLSVAAVATGTSALWLTWLFVAYLLVTTLVYLRLTSGAKARSSQNVLMTPNRPFMQWPTLSALWREAWGTIRQFLLLAMPVFIAICITASLLAHVGALDLASEFLGPVMRLFDLPAQTALAVVLASIRKDGILLLAADAGPSFALTAAQALTAVYLAGVLLPCLVTAMTIARETGWRSTSTLLARQAAFAILFALILAWGGRWLI
ncbi:nucleoside recognition domain-containing protein [Halochromatium sp.]